MGIERVTNKSAEDPEATGLVEAFMRHLKKIFNMAGVEKEDLYLRINNYWMQFRATPHSTMRKSPAELLFSRKFVTKLPDLRTNPARGRRDIEEAREENRQAKDKLKEYKDDSREVKEHSIKAGDMVIAKRKVTKHDSVYDPKPYKVVATYGTQIKGEREDGKKKTRDSQNWKNMEVNKKTSYAEVVRSSRYQEEADIRAGTREETGAGGQGREGAGGGQVQEGASGRGQDGAEGQVQEGARADIQARLRRAPKVIETDTWTNRTERTRQPRNFYQAGAREKEGRPGRGRKDR